MRRLILALLFVPFVAAASEPASDIEKLPLLSVTAQKSAPEIAVDKLGPLEPPAQTGPVQLPPITVQAEPMRYRKLTVLIHKHHRAAMIPARKIARKRLARR